MRVAKCISVGLISLTLNGCSNNMNNLHEMTWLDLGGTLGGALIGGYAGSQIGAGFGQILYMTTGTLVGGSAGYSVSRVLNPSDQTSYKSTVHQALENSKDGEIIRWNNPETGREGIFRALNTYKQPNGQKCRQYRASVVFSDGIFSGGGIACQIANGSWFKSFDEFS